MERKKQRTLVTTALIVLWCAGCAAVDPAFPDRRLVEAQNAFEEGKRLKEAGKYAEAVAVVEQAQTLRESALPETHPQIADCLDLLGEVHILKAGYSRAESLLERALKIRESAQGETHPDFSNSLSNLADLYKVQGLYTRAEPLGGWRK